MDETSDARRLPKLLVVGFPKSGTSTIQRALEESGLVSAHWMWRNRPVGRLIYDGWFSRGDPLALLEGVDAVTQMDFCMPAQGVNLWPNLDIALLLTIRRLHPDCRFILNYRPPQATESSFGRWNTLVERITESDIPGLPRGRGGRPGEVTRWIGAHLDAMRQVFAGDPNFLELDITAPDAAERLGAFLGHEIRWWGVANANPDGKR
ncbi:sulfotransferase [Paenirhodobacter hankyongi]|uniref:Sulfotransferase family protein n=1 Tax=Paenirhodobacter hankyongi TaxID=2294033 RepID=A0A421BXJ2_9RHOB|nr:sulfotransferase [Sinirhodobacter hankyongi]RLL72999.1 sulfotransferase family protein [Sinirhodobacter hankyongi]